MRPDAPSFENPRTFPLRSGEVSLGTSTSGPGILGFGADWTLAGNRVAIYLTDDSCSSLERFQAGSCVVLARNEDLATKPKNVGVSSGGRTRYYLWVRNFGPGDETVTVGYSIVL
jgi:hypothetical protein